jgi:hypothetical protein
MTPKAKNAFRGLFFALMAGLVVYLTVRVEVQRMTAQIVNVRHKKKIEQQRLDSLKIQVKAHEELIERLKRTQIELTKSNRHERATSKE